MKCLLYNFALNDSEDLKKHYIEFHKVDQDNQFFYQSIQETEQHFSSK